MNRLELASDVECAAREALPVEPGRRSRAPAFGEGGSGGRGPEARGAASSGPLLLLCNAECTCGARSSCQRTHGRSQKLAEAPSTRESADGGTRAGPRRPCFCGRAKPLQQLRRPVNERARRRSRVVAAARSSSRPFLSRGTIEKSRTRGSLSRQPVQSSRGAPLRPSNAAAR